MTPPPPLSNQKRPKSKRPILAAILGLIFGPFSTLYFGWKVLLTTLIVVFSSTLFIAWAMPIPFPKWYGWTVGIFFGFWNYILAVTFNTVLEDEDEGFSLAALNLIGMEGWYIRFLAVIMGLYSGIMLIKDERWLAALVVVFLYTPLTIWLFETVAVLLRAMLMIALERKR